MRAVLQRVTGATVHVNGKLISRIGPGIVALIGIGTEDTQAEIAPLCTKILATKLWNENQLASHIAVPPQYAAEQQTPANGDAPTPAALAAAPGEGVKFDGDAAAAGEKSRSEEVWGGKPWKRNVMEIQGEILCISQFTLHARLTKGTKPDFHKSMGGAQAKELYDELLAKLRTQYVAERVKDGAFGEMMQCSLTNDGPVTILVDTDIKK
ncbi:D-tyrosyl-tRNA deacylase [Acaromyces ingoldii]|uniref:D-aminoacyl-tRNA deacylase n=1 Tax=Acaromyces ingoldii TaxID=215250 RepID=A0A316YEV1_9BASI|nr:D-tyrosyl-tRNA deacylase [Acaromyces ingoldii]PWN87404.1 D-tyrosyl-tRNA deacylase [Acaromyces ingoldii]